MKKNALEKENVDKNLWSLRVFFLTQSQLTFAVLSHPEGPFGSSKDFFTSKPLTKDSALLETTSIPFDSHFWKAATANCANQIS